MNELSENIIKAIEWISDNYITSLSDDSDPRLSNNLRVGNHSIVYDIKPRNDEVHGYDVGWSGDTSFMGVSDNDTGFGCPLYMRENGTWAQCSSAKGSDKMPCMALALDEDTGTKEILWKGIIRKGTWTWIPGNLIYVSNVEGALTKVKPIDGSWAQIVGMAIAPDTIRFDSGFYLGQINL